MAGLGELLTVAESLTFFRQNFNIIIDLFFKVSNKSKTKRTDGQRRLLSFCAYKMLLGQNFVILY